jgi:D-threo-aldose 1-dehydrogenase
VKATDQVEIGATGLRVTRLGLGGVALSGAPPATDPAQNTSEMEATHLIHRSLELGVNYLDTAPMYGLGQSEMRYGDALRGVERERYVISTKVGRVLDPVEPGGTEMAWSFDFSREGAIRSFESSLQRLGLDHVDILYVHDPDDHYQQALTQTLPFLMELRDQGRVKAIGAGMNQWEMELQFAKESLVDCFLLAGRYTLLDQSALPEFLPYCVEQNISVVAGGPYNSGILAVGPREGATFNYRAASPEMMDKARAIHAVCERHQVPLRAAALQFILAHPALASVIPGARSVSEVEENVQLIEFPIPPVLWAELKAEKLIAEAAPTPG